MFKMLVDFLRKKLSAIKFNQFVDVPKQNLHLNHLNYTDRICSTKRS